MSTPTSSNNASSSQHKITVKVLRLSRPTLPKTDLSCPENAFNDSPDLSFSSFGLVHVGETFTSMISANNASELTNHSAYKVTLSAHVQLPATSDTVSLLHSDSPDSSQTLQPDETTQRVVSYEPKEAGLHTLTIKLSYKPVNDEAALAVTFLKHYQFNATPGLSVKTKVSQCSSEEYTIEAQIENVSTTSIALETAELLAADGWSATPFVVTQHTIHLMPREVYQTAFVLARDENEPSQPQPQPQQAGMSRLSLSWRRNMGERGFMTTGPLKLH